MLNKVKPFLLKLIKNPLFYLTLGLFVIDLITKWIIVHTVPIGSNEIVIIPHLIVITHVQNTGAVFGLGNGSLGGRIGLIIIRLALAIAIPIIYFLKGQGLKKRYKVAICLIYAGCIGNLIDGMFYWKNTVGFDGVIDWIKFPFWKFVFNLADSYIVIAVVLLIIYLIIDEIVEVKAKSKTGVYSLTPEEYEAKMREENKAKNGYTSNENKSKDK